MLNFYQIDDGATHAVVARDEAEAYGLYAESLIRSGVDWPEERPSIETMTDDKDYALHPDGGAEQIKLKVGLWRHLFDKPQYVGCSEW